MTHFISDFFFSCSLNVTLCNNVRCGEVMSRWCGRDGDGELTVTGGAQNARFCAVCVCIGAGRCGMG